MVAICPNSQRDRTQAKVSDVPLSDCLLSATFLLIRSGLFQSSSKRLAPRPYIVSSQFSYKDFCAHTNYLLKIQ